MFWTPQVKVDLHSVNLSRMADVICWHMVSFNLRLRWTKMSCSLNKFVLFNNQKQPLKCVWQNSYLDLWPNTLYIFWQGVHLLVKLHAGKESPSTNEVKVYGLKQQLIMGMLRDLILKLCNFQSLNGDQP